MFNTFLGSESSPINAFYLPHVPLLHRTMCYQLSTVRTVLVWLHCNFHMFQFHESDYSMESLIDTARPQTVWDSHMSTIKWGSLTFPQLLVCIKNIHSVMLLLVLSPQNRIWLTSWLLWFNESTKVATSHWCWVNEIQYIGWKFKTTKCALQLLQTYNLKFKFYRQLSLHSMSWWCLVTALICSFVHSFVLAGTCWNKQWFAISTLNYEPETPLGIETQNTVTGECYVHSTNSPFLSSAQQLQAASMWFCSAIWLEPPDIRCWKPTVLTPQYYQVLPPTRAVRGSACMFVGAVMHTMWF